MSERKIFLAILFAAMASGAGIANAEADPAPGAVPIRHEFDLTYGKGRGEDLKLDLYTPQPPAKRQPAVVIIHGGGWVEGSKEELRATAIFMAMRGYVAVSIDYRLAPKYRFPAQLEDAKCAVRWLRANAEKYQIDGDRIGAIGGSAGAHLALLLGFTGSGHEFDGTGGHPEQSSRVAAVVNWMGPADLTSPDWPAATMIVIQDLIGSDQRTSPAAYRAASPLSYIRKGIPPVLSMYGTKDTVVPYDQATRLDAALRKAGVESKLETLKGIGHGEGLTALNLLRILQESADFLDSHMKSK